MPVVPSTSCAGAGKQLEILPSMGSLSKPMVKSSHPLTPTALPRASPASTASHSLVLRAPVKLSLDFYATRVKRRQEQVEKRREKGSECFLSRGGKEEKVEQKEVETLGGEGGGWLKTTFSACTSGPSPQRPFATSRHFATPCAGLKLKSEHRPPPTVRTCFLGGLSAESKDEESCSRGSADS